MRIVYGGKSPVQSSMSLHSHATWEILAIIRGEGEITVGADAFRFDPYSIICIPPRVQHAELADELYQDYWFQVADFPFHDESAPILLSDDAGHAVEALMGLIYPILHRRGQEHTEKLMEHLVDALEELLLLRTRQTPPDIRVGQVIRLLTQNMSDPAYRVDRALAESGYCPDHIRRLFLSETGKTPHEYLTDLRIRAAKRLLLLRRGKRDPLDSVAESCGFSDAAYFSRVFKARVGVPPSTYVGELPPTTT